MRCDEVLCANCKYRNADEYSETCFQCKRYYAFSGHSLFFEPKVKGCDRPVENNYSDTEKRITEIANKINTLLKLEKFHDMFCPHYKPVWNGYERNYYIRYCVEKEKWIVRYDVDFRSDIEVYFSTKMIALTVCDILNKNEGMRIAFA